jgi:hypothetical protein
MPLFVQGGFSGVYVLWLPEQVHDRSSPSSLWVNPA